jgi:Rod binding domain-containing protein
VSTAITIQSGATHFDLPGTDGRFDVAGPRRDGEAEMRKQVGKFVAGTFFGIMLKTMRSTVPEDGLMSGGRGEQIFRQMFDMELADRFSDGSNFPQVEAAIRQLSGQRYYRERLPMRADDPAMLAQEAAMTMGNLGSLMAGDDE